MPKIARADFRSWADYYRHYQATLARRFLMPFMEAHGVTLVGKRLLDIGCGDGGCTTAFAEKAEYCLGIDIGDFPWTPAPNLEFRRGDILAEEVGRSLEGRFDVVVLRDVIEHIADKPRLMEHVKSAVRGSGSALVTFPPFYSAFGAHQQVELRGSPLRYVPYVHGLPSLRHIASTRMTVSGFEKLVTSSGMRVLARRLYLIRPSFELRYGLPTIAFPFPRAAGVREVLCSGASYLVQWAGG